MERVQHLPSTSTGNHTSSPSTSTALRYSGTSTALPYSSTSPSTAIAVLEYGLEYRAPVLESESKSRKLQVGVKRNLNPMMSREWLIEIIPINVYGTVWLCNLAFRFRLMALLALAPWARPRISKYVAKFLPAEIISWHQERHPPSR